MNTRNYITEATRNRILAVVEDACETAEAWTCGESVDYIMFRAWDSHASDAWDSMPCDLRVTMGEVVDRAKGEIVQDAKEHGFGEFEAVVVGEPDGFGWRGFAYVACTDCSEAWDALVAIAERDEVRAELEGVIR